MKATASILVLISLFGLAACSSSSVRGPMPLNAFHAPSGRQQMIRNGAQHLTHNQSIGDVKALVGWPDITRPWRAPMPLSLLPSYGPLLGTEFEYWLEWQEFGDNRWLTLRFDQNGKLATWSGNLNGKYFDCPPPSSNQALQRTAPGR